METNRNKVCAIFGCYATPGVQKQYHRFPKDPIIRKIWIRKCRRCDFVNPETATICGLHFSDFQQKSNLKYELLNIKTPLNYRSLLLNAVPDINLPTTTSLTIPASSTPRNTDVLHIGDCGTGTVASKFVFKLSYFYRN